jgi:hypothetical protein
MKAILILAEMMQHLIELIDSGEFAEMCKQYGISLLIPIPDPHHKMAIIMESNFPTTRWKLTLAQITPKILQKRHLPGIKLMPNPTARAQQSTHVP